LQALIIIGHGSHLNADSSAPVYRHAEAIRRTGVFDEVRECFWKEEPPSVTTKLGKTIRYCGPVGTHPSMAAMILRRAEETAGLSHDEARGAGLVIIGHGTERNSNSSEVIYRVTREAAEAGAFGQVRTGFLDQEPEVGRVLGEMEEERIVLVPFFVAEGWHTQETIPDDLGINRPAVSARTERGGRTIWYAPPVGTFPEIARIILQRAREAGAEMPDEVEIAEAAGV